MDSKISEASCMWYESEERYWETECDKAFCLNDGSPHNNEMIYCPFCGKMIAEDEQPTIAGVEMKKYKKLTKEFNDLMYDVERWAWIRKNQDTGVLIMLDNDDTYGVFDDDEWRESEEGCLQFDGYIGTGPGIGDLLISNGIRHEQV